MTILTRRGRRVSRVLLVFYDEICDEIDEEAIRRLCGDALHSRV